jgi:hypothetical protein
MVADALFLRRPEGQAPRRRIEETWDETHEHTLARARLCYDQHMKRVQTDK